MEAAKELSGENQLLAEGEPGVWVEEGSCPAEGTERLASACLSARKGARDAAHGCVPAGV